MLVVVRGQLLVVLVVVLGDVAVGGDDFGIGRHGVVVVYKRKGSPAIKRPSSGGRGVGNIYQLGLDRPLLLVLVLVVWVEGLLMQEGDSLLLMLRSLILEIVLGGGLD